MKPLFLGTKPDGTKGYLPAELRQQTHMHVIGGSGKGKSKFLEHILRQDIHEAQGLCLLDWHGTLEHYRRSKQRLLDYQLQGDFALLGERDLPFTANKGVHVSGPYCLPNGLGPDLALRVPSQATARVQEAHAAILHAICAAVDDAFADV